MKVKTIDIKAWTPVPSNFTGIARRHFDHGEIERQWFKDGVVHRKGNKPAIIIPDGTKIWFINGKYHRTDGPAVEWADGRVEYWINGERTYKEAVEVYRWLFPGSP